MSLPALSSGRLGQSGARLQLPMWLRTVVLMVACCTAGGAMTAFSSKVLAIVAGIVVIVFVCIFCYKVLSLTNASWCTLAAALMLLVTLGNLDLTAFGIHLPWVSSKDVLMLSVLLVVLGLSPFFQVAGEHRLRFSYVIPVVALYAVAVSYSSLFSLASSPVWNAFWAILPMLVFVAAIWVCKSQRDLVTFFVLGGALAVLSALMGAMQGLVPYGLSDFFAQYLLPGYSSTMYYAIGSLGRLTSIWGQPTPYAMYLSVLVPALGFAARHYNGKASFAAKMGVPVVFWAIFLTGARTALCAAILGLIITQWSHITGRSKLAIPLAALTGITALALVVLMIPDNPIQSFTDSIMQFFDRGGAGYSDSWVSRTQIYRILIDCWTQSPLIGVGPGSVAEIISQYGIKNSTGHSFWLQLFAEVGLIGGLFYLSLVASMVPVYRKALRLYGRNSSVIKCCIAISAVVLLQSVTDNSLLLWQFASIFWLIQGAVIALVKFTDQGEFTHE